MKQFKSFIYFLVFLLLFQPGCTAIGHQVGKDLDKKHPKRVKYERTGNMERGDIIELTLNDDTILHGKVAYYEVEKFIGLTDLATEFDEGTYNEMQVYEWKEIKKIRKLEKREIGRLVFSLVGLGIDLFVILLFVYAEAMADSISGLS